MLTTTSVMMPHTNDQFNHELDLGRENVTNFGYADSEGDCSMENYPTSSRSRTPDGTKNLDAGNQTASYTQTGEQIDASGSAAVHLSHYGVDVNSLPSVTQAQEASSPELSVSTSHKTETKRHASESHSTPLKRSAGHHHPGPSQYRQHGPDPARNTATTLGLGTAFNAISSKSHKPTTMPNEGKDQKASSTQPVDSTTGSDSWYNLSQYWQKLWKSSEANAKSLTNENSRLHGIIHDLKLQVSELGQAQRQEIINLQRAHHERERNFDLKIKKLEQESMARAESVQRAQAAAKVMIEQSKSFASSESEVKAWFEGQSAAWYNWAKDFAHDDEEELLRTPGESWNEIVRIVVLKDGRLPEELTMAGWRAPYLLLQGMVANFICTHAFSSPWSIFDALQAFDPKLDRTRQVVDGFDDAERTRILDAVRRDVPTMQEHMEVLFQMLQNLQEDSSHRWRVSLMRFFSVNGMGSKANVASHSSNNTLLESRTRYARNLSRMFLAGPAEHLLRDMTPDEMQECEESLADQIDRALQRSVSLWTHTSYMRCLGLAHPDLASFDGRSELMRPHQAQQLSQSRRCGGAPVVMVVQPAIVVCGTEEGDGYSQSRRVWMPAKVLVSARQHEADPEDADAGRW